MASTATPLGFNKQGTGDNPNTWGEKLNAEALDLIDEAIRGRAAFALTGTYTLDATNYESNEARCMLLHATSGTGGTVIIPTTSKLYVAWNQSSGDMIISTGGATTATLETGDLTVIFCDGDKVRQLMIAGMAIREYIEAATLSEVELPAQTGNGGKFIRTNGTSATWERIQSGDIEDFDTAIAGKNSIWIPAGAMVPRTTNGAATGLAESTTNKVMSNTLDFDQSTIEYAQFQIAMPKSWNESTLTAEFIWTCGVTGNVIWGLQGVCISDDDLLDAAFGTAVEVTDAVTATTDVMRSAESSAMTMAGTPAENDLGVFQVYRKASDGGDTAAGDAKLLGVRLFLTTSANNDA